MRRFHITLTGMALFLGAVALVGVSPSSAASNGPRPKQPISRNFDDGDGIPGLEIGYGDFSAQCQTYIGGANPYQPFTTSVNVISGDKVNVGAGVNQGCYAPQNETTIAVNPANPNNLVAGSNDYRDCCVVSGTSLRNDGSGWAYTSMDGGRTWANIKLPGLGSSGDPNGVFKKVTSVGDPAISFGKNNTVYYANIAFNRVDNSDVIVVSVSHDGGLTWGQPVLVANSGGAVYFNDKVWVGANPANGEAYISWTRFKDNPQIGYVESPIVVSRTSDYGTTWSSWTGVSGPYRYNQGSVPIVGNDGTVYISFEGAVAADNYNDYNIVAKSTDRGATWTQTVVSRNTDENFPTYGGRGVLTGYHFRTNTFPALTIDRVAGRLHMAWADNRLGNSTTTNVQVYTQSSADGLAWTTPVRVTSGNSDRIYPWVAANGGKVVISYYTTEYATGLQLDMAASVSTDGGATFGAARRLTEESSDPFIQFAGGAFIGDYTGIAMGSDNVAHAIWTDFRGNPGVNLPGQDAVTASIS